MSKPELNMREQILIEARSWLGTKFLHQGRSQSGVDCAGLLYCVFSKVVKLSNDYQLYPDGLTSGMVFRYIKNYGDRINKHNAGPGDVVLMCFNNLSTHLGIFAGDSVIHADRYIGKVVEHSISKTDGRVVAYFRIRGVPSWLNN